MFSNIEKIEIQNIISGISKLRAAYTSRSSHAFVFKLSGHSHYTFSDTVIQLSQGEMLFIPEGASYTVQRTSQDTGHYILVNFHAQLPDAQPKKYCLQHHVDFSHICSRLSRYRAMDTAADRFGCMSLFYQILSYLSEMDRQVYTRNTTRSQIDRAVEYLQEHVFDPGLRVGMLHTLCNISDTYFRKIFIARFGVSPKKYVLNKRLSQAKAILDQGECQTVGQAALLAGFDDGLYFCKVFKKRYGYPPSQSSAWEQENPI